MSDLFTEKNIKPMLIGAESGPFDDSGYLYELKIDGERCVAYLDPETGTDLRNKRNIRMLPKVPELEELHRNVDRRCILDGELAVITEGRPDFFAIQRRSLMTSPQKIRLAVRQHPACFVAFDLLYLGDHATTDLPLAERKRLLRSVVCREDARFAVSRCVEQHGAAFYELVREQKLEGIVAKRRESRYYFDKRTKDWVKIKYLQDEEFVVCGYLRKENHMTSIVLGQYRDGQMVFKGHVTLGVGGENFRAVQALPRRSGPPFPVPEGHGEAVWVEPVLTCTVQYMMRTESGGMRQPVFKGLRPDKEPAACVEVTTEQKG